MDEPVPHAMKGMIRKIRRFIGGQLKSHRGRRDLQRILSDGQEIPGFGESRDCWGAGVREPTRFYNECVRYFHRSLPAGLRAHREYFKAGQRGFGEDAFHVMWFLLFKEHAPHHCLEIGVFRGQALSLMSLLQQRAGILGEVAGISPFEAVGDSVSEYRGGVDYLEDTLANFSHFSLSKPHLLKAYSTDSQALELIRSRPWDCIYIDGNHDYEIARADWFACSDNVRPGGIVVLDDAGLTTSYRPPAFATGGHPGPSRVADEIDRSKFEEILQVGHNRVFQKRNA